MIDDRRDRFFARKHGDGFVGIFIDVENVTDLDEQDIKHIFDEVAQYGPVAVRRAYGCWSKQHEILSKVVFDHMSASFEDPFQATSSFSSPSTKRTPSMSLAMS